MHKPSPRPLGKPHNPLAHRMNPFGQPPFPELPHNTDDAPSLTHFPVNPTSHFTGAMTGHVASGHATRQLPSPQIRLPSPLCTSGHSLNAGVSVLTPGRRV